MKYLLLFILWLLTTTVKSQSPNPGGVKGAIHWYCTDASSTSPGLRSLLSGNNTLLSFPNARVEQLNFHPSLLIDGQNALRIDLGNHDLRNSSYFTVYQSRDTTDENIIWNITNSQQTSLVLTTDRMADLSTYQYMNYIDVIRKQPKVNVYVQQKEKDSLIITNQWWNIGVKPTTPQLPIVNFKGLVPEIIAYDRVLSARERLQVASYLALKYSITLTEPAATYLNSAGEKIWDGYDYTDWHRNIAGIGRDDSSGLKQSIASSSNIPGLLTISTNDSLSNNSFLLWGDNGKELIPAPKIPGLPVLLQQTWLMKTYNNPHPLKTNMIIDTRFVDAPLSSQPVYWLAIDRTGKEQFNSPTTEFIKMDKLDPKGNVYFNNVIWGKDGSGRDVWGIIAGQYLLLATTINQPTCALPNTGSLQVKILGGNGPYQFTIRNNSGFNVNQYIQDNTSTVDFSNLSTGKYFLKVTDAAQHLYLDSFYINNTDVPLSAALADHYTIPAGRSLSLDAAAGMPDQLQWEWNGPDNFQSYNAKISVTTPGLYILRSSKNGCVSEQDITITSAPSNILYDVTVYPNPSTAAFSARVTLGKPAAVTMSIYTLDGRLVSTQKGDGRMNYLFTGELKTSGVYELVFISGLSKANRRLVIAK
jgi:hypothetical protein